ncbi:antirepressor protein [Oceanospirillum phage vB_OliS_GJ44]|nr:antirepressor protein [Oceanospirillum phage vB_OliS_GJ44]
MTDLIQGSTSMRMSTREIAELTQKRHSNVMRTAESLGESGVITLSQIEKVENPGSGPTWINHYTLDKRDSLVLVARLSPEFTAAVVDRWQELESKQAMAALPNFNNPVEAARAWADEVEQKQAALLELEQAKPKAAFYDAVTQSGDAISMDEVAKVLNLPGLGRNKLFRLLREKGVLQTGGVKHNQPYQRHVDAGRFRLVETSWVADNGDVRVNLKTVVLQKGLDYIRKIASE